MYVLAGLLPFSALLIIERERSRNKHPPDLTNIKAFLLMLQYSEGTYGANAYRTLYGGGVFQGYGSHPGIAVTANGLTSTAAGAYQILQGTWQSVQAETGLPDFSPASQDRAAVELVRRRGALGDVMEGKIVTAIDKCRKEWASLPGAGYGQHEQKLTTLLQVYQQAGGRFSG
ncbi:MAG: glycoside hydrolase family 104 protein [Chitinophagales bacterium]